MTGSLPYENVTSGDGAIAELRRIVSRFGVQRFGVMEDYDKGELTIQFEYRGRRISMSASAKGYAALWLRSNPWSTHRRYTRQEWEARATEIGQMAAKSILRDLVKAQLAAVEAGIASFEAVFLRWTLLPSGETVAEAIEAAPERIGLPAPEEEDR